MNDSYVYAIVALLPLSAAMLVIQSNPYHALVTRGILGAVAAFVYTVLGAADVALTEALVGTMLAITLYAIAVRSSLVLRLGVLPDQTDDHHFVELMDNFRTIFGKFHLRLELVKYKDIQTLHQALINKEVHATCAVTKYDEQNDAISGEDKPYHIVTRIRRIYDIIQAELKSPATSLSYVCTSEVSTADLKTPVLGEHL
jgi:putative multicomponent Na+:H+ antiporter subunit B